MHWVVLLSLAACGLAIGRLGDRVFGAVPCAGPCTIAGAPYATAGADIALVSFDAAAHATVIGALAGGAMAFDQFAAIEPDALAVSFAAGPTTTAFGALTLTPPGMVNALAVFGVD